MAENRMPAAERRTQILKCAVKVFARSNYQSARVADIAAEAGISEAAVYKYFPSKKSIYLEILKHMSNRIVTFWQEEVDREPDAVLAIRNMGMTYYRRMIRHPDELKVQFQAISEVGDPEIADRLNQDHQAYRGFIQGVIEKGILQGRIRESVSADTMGWLFNGMGIMMNVMNILPLKEEFNEDTVAQILDYLIQPLTD